MCPQLLSPPLPDDRMIMTATSMGKGESSGKLVFFERDTFHKVVELEVGTSHVIRTLWHPRLNQVRWLKISQDKSRFLFLG